MDFLNEEDEPVEPAAPPPVGRHDDVTSGRAGSVGSRSMQQPPLSYPEATADFSPRSNLNVPGQDFDFDFENRIVPGDGGGGGGDDVITDSVIVLNERNQSGRDSGRKRRSIFHRNRKKKHKKPAAASLLDSFDSEDFSYDNHVALEGVENAHPAIVVSAVRDAVQGCLAADDNICPVPAPSSPPPLPPPLVSVSPAEGDGEPPDEDGVSTEGTLRWKSGRRHKNRKFSIASALTDISFRSERSNSTKVSSPSLLDVDWEADDDLRDSLSEFIKNRGGGGGSRRRRRKRGSQSTRSSDSEADERETADLLDMYSEKQTSQDRILENIRLQKELMETVRTQPWPLKKKLKTLQLAKSYVERYEGQLSRGHGYQEASAKYWKRVKREFMNFLSLLIPWEMRIKLIESYFGSVVASYFTFLRWLFWVNIIMTIFSLCFIVIPEVLWGAPYGSSPQKTLPASLVSRALNFGTIMDWRGYMEYSILFFGYYENTTIIGGVYRLPLAYLLVGLSSYGVSFLIILRKMTANSRLNKLTSKHEQFSFTWKTFTTWDFMIGNAETAKNKVAEITTVLRETIEEEKERTKKETTKTLIFLRVVANMLVLIVLASSTYAINLVVVRSKQVELRLEAGEEIGWWDQNEVSFVMSLITALFPSLFDLIGLMEKYHPRINLRLQLGRILVLYLMNLYTLMFALFWKIVDKSDGANIIANCTQTIGSTLSPESDTVTVTDLGDTSTAVTLNCTGAIKDRVCWETMLGQEISKLVFFDLIVTVATILIIDLVRGLGVRYLNRYWCWDLEQKFPEYGEFKIAENLLHAIYNQATVWLGMFFAPLLPAVNLLKMVVMLYIRSWAVIVCNIPHERVFRASRSNNFYFGTLLLMLFLVTLPVAFLLVQLKPSSDCGPFKGFTKSYQVLTKTFEAELPEWANKGLNYIASPGIIMPLLLLLLMAIYYLLSLNASLKESNDDLRNQLLYERTEEREKVYKLAEARLEAQAQAAASSGGDGGTKPPHDHLEALPTGAHRSGDQEGDVDSGEESLKAPPPTGDQPVERGTRVMRIPGMSLDQANLLKSKFPGLRVMSRDDAVRLQILPPPPPPPPEPESDPEPEVKVIIDPAPDAEPDSPVHTSGESEHLPDHPQKPGDTKADTATAPPEVVTPPVAQSRPAASRARGGGPGSSPPVAVVRGKPSIQHSRYRSPDPSESSPDDAVLF